MGSQQTATNATPGLVTQSPLPCSAHQLVVQALATHPYSTYSEVAALSGVLGATTQRVLSQARKQGLVDRVVSERSGARRSPDLWYVIGPDDGGQTSAEDDASCSPVESAGLSDYDDELDEALITGHDEVATAPQDGDVAETGMTPAETVTTAERPAERERLGKGALRGLVEDFLRERPKEEFGPSTIGKALNRSAGAVNNACEKLVTEGYARRTRQKPKRFTIAADEPTS